MRAVLVFFVRTFLFLLQPYNLTGLECIILVTLIITGNLLIGNANLLAYHLEGVSLTGIQVVVLIINMYGMKLCFTTHGLVGTRTLGHELVVTLGFVVLVEFIEFDDAYQLGGIAWIGGIAGSLQTVCPSLIVGDGEIERLL